jgi:hypothetical protein
VQDEVHRLVKGIRHAVPKIQFCPIEAADGITDQITYGDQFFEVAVNVFVFRVV